MLARLQRRDDARLLLRGDLGEHVGALGGSGQLGIAHRLHLAPQQKPGDLQPDVPADLAGDEIVVAGDDLHRHAGSFQPGDGGGGSLLRRIDEGDKAS